MPSARILPPIDSVMDHRVLALRSPVSGVDTFYFSWFTFDVTASGTIGNLAFWRHHDEDDGVEFRVLTDALPLYDAMIESTAPRADRARYLTQPPIESRFEVGPLVDPHRGRIESPRGVLEMTWAGLHTPIFAAGPTPAPPDTHDIYSVLVEASDGRVLLDDRPVDGAPFPNEIWREWLGRPMSSALIAIGEVVISRSKDAES